MTGARLRKLLVATLLVAGCGQTQSTGCAGCAGQSYQYPMGTAGKEPAQNAAGVRINKAAIDFVKANLDSMMTGLCCDYDAIPAPGRLETAAETCWGQAPCFIASEGGEKRVHFYLGSVGAPLKFDAPVVGEIELRNGDPFPLQSVIDRADTPAARARPYCNDLGGETFARQAQNLDRFCVDPAAQPTLCNDPANDYCCGGLFHGRAFWTDSATTQLDVCYKNDDGVRERLSVPRRGGYPSNVSLPLAALTGEGNIELDVLPASVTKPAGVGIRLRDLPLSVDLAIAVPQFEVLGSRLSVACRANDEGNTPSLLMSDLAFGIRPRFVRNAPNLPQVLDLCPTCLDIESVEFDLNLPNTTADRRDVACQDSNWFNDRDVGTFWVDAGLECSTGCGLTSFAGDVITPIFNLAQGLLIGPIVDAIAGAVVGELNGMPVEVQTQLAPRDLLADVLDLRFGRLLGLYVAPNASGLQAAGVGADAGLTVAVDVGVESERELCVPERAPPALPQLSDPGLAPTVSVLDTSTQPPTVREERYHLGAALSVPALQRVLYSAFNSGLLCLGMGTSDVARLTGGEQVITAGLLYLLVPELQLVADPGAPIFFELEPTQAPRITLGSGQPTGQLDSSGKPIIDSLLKASIPELQLSFFASMQGRLVRVFALKTDFDVALSILRGADNKLQLSVDKIAVNNMATTFSELMGSDFTKLLTMLLDLVTGTLLQNNLVFDLDFDEQLKQVFGSMPLALRINDIQRAGSNGDYLAAYVTLCDEPSQRDPSNRVCCSQAKTNGMCGTPVVTPVGLYTETAGQHLLRGALTPVLSDAIADYEPPTTPLPPSLRADAVPSGRATLSVRDEDGRFDPALRYVARVDFGAYLSARYADGNGVLTIESPRLLVPGRHRIDVTVLPPGSLELPDATQTAFVVVDPERPLVRLTEAANGIEVAAEDLVAKAEELTVVVRTRSVSGEVTDWRPTAANAVLSRAQLAPGATVLEAQAFDTAGNASDIARLDLPRARIDDQGCGCASTTSDAMFGHALLAMVVAALLGRRRQRG